MILLGILGLLIGICIWAGILLPIGMALWGLVKWRGGWRVAAAVPFAVLTAFFAPLINDWRTDPTAHNLWGLVFIPVALVLLVYSLVVIFMRRRRFSS
jgi:hypothetical protein